MDEELIRCGADGIFIWPGVPLVEKRGPFYARVSERDIANRAGVLFGPEVLYARLIPTLERAARFGMRTNPASADGDRKTQVTAVDNVWRNACALGDCALA